MKTINLSSNVNSYNGWESKMPPMRTEIFRAVSLLLGLWKKFLKNIPFYLQIKLHGDFEQKQKMDEIYQVWIREFFNVLRILSIYIALPFVVLVVFFAVIFSIEFVAVLLYNIGRLSIISFLGINFIGLTVGLLIFLFRELRHILFSDNTTTESSSSSYSSSAKKSKSKSISLNSEVSKFTSSSDDVQTIELPEGDYHKFETDEFGQLK